MFWLESWRERESNDSARRRLRLNFLKTQMQQRDAGHPARQNSGVGPWSGDGGAEFQRSFPGGSLLAGKFAAASYAGELIAELQLTESLERSACAEGRARPERGQEFLVGAKPLQKHARLGLGSTHFSRIPLKGKNTDSGRANAIGLKCKWETCLGSRLW